MTPTSPRLHAITAGLCAVSMAAAAIGICDADGFGPLDVLWLAGSVLATLVGAAIGRRASQQPGATLEAVGPLLLACYAGNALAEPIIRVAGGGRPLEVVLYAGMAALLPILAAGAAARRWVPVAGVVALAVTLFGVCLLSSPAVAAAAAVWAALMPIWLAVLADESTRGVRVGTGRGFGKIAITAAIAIGLGLLGLLAAALGGRDSLSLSRGFLASSGGDGRESDYARDGVGDGRHLVPATTMAESFGPIDDAPFAKTDEPSLYDVFDERYDPPEGAFIKQNDRAVSLKPSKVQKQEREMADAEAAGQAFSTLRSPRDERRGKVGDKLSDALFYVAGRVPLHLRTGVLESFDGVVWRSGPFADAERFDLTMRTVDGQPWLTLRDAASTRYEQIAKSLSEVEPHAIKPVHIDDPRIPLPPSATAVHIRNVATRSMFSALPGRCLTMDRKRLPKMVPIHIASRRVDRERLTETAKFFSGPHELHALPPDPQIDAVAAVAAAWVDGHERGWPQIAEIERRLRGHAIVTDTMSGIPTDTSSDSNSLPVAHFVLAADGDRRGPDYLFATAAAVMLRSQGYAARLVTGFYADPEKYDPEGRHTPVHAADLHTWCEVRMAGGGWVTLEPTPGYDVLQPRRSLWERMLKSLQTLPGRLWQQRATLAAAALLLAVAVALRQRLRDLAWVALLWLTGRFRDPAAAWQLVDWRLRQTAPMPAGWTPRRRLRELAPPSEAAASLAELIDAVDRQTFAPASSNDADPSDATYADAVAAASLTNLRRWRSESTASSDRCEPTRTADRIDQPRPGTPSTSSASTPSDAAKGTAL